MIQRSQTYNKKELLSYISSYLYKILKPIGFKKNGNSFYQESAYFTKIIALKSLSGVELNEIDCTLSWGLDFKLDKYFYQRKKIKKPSINQILIGDNLPSLKECQSRIWKLLLDSSEQEIEKCFQEIEYYIINYGIPFLNKLNTLQDVIDMLETTKGEYIKNRLKGKSFFGFYPVHINPEPFQAILYLYDNNKEKSLSIMDEIIATTKSDLYRENMSSLKEKIKAFDPLLYIDKY